MGKKFKKLIIKEKSKRIEIKTSLTSISSKNKICKKKYKKFKSTFPFF